MSDNHECCKDHNFDSYCACCMGECEAWGIAAEEMEMTV